MPISTILAVLRGEDPDALTQTQREALVDIALWMAVVDGVLAPEEMAAIKSKAQSLRWESETPLTRYFDQVKSKLVDATVDAGAREVVLADIVDRLGTPKARKHALAAITRFAATDGEVAPEEQQLIEDFKVAVAAANAE